MLARKSHKWLVSVFVIDIWENEVINSIFGILESYLHIALTQLSFSLSAMILYLYYHSSSSQNSKRLA